MPNFVDSLDLKQILIICRSAAAPQ